MQKKRHHLNRIGNITVKVYFFFSVLIETSFTFASRLAHQTCFYTHAIHLIFILDSKNKTKLGHFIFRFSFVFTLPERLDCRLFIYMKFNVEKSEYRRFTEKETLIHSKLELLTKHFNEMLNESMH